MRSGARAHGDIDKERRKCVLVLARAKGHRLCVDGEMTGELNCHLMYLADLDADYLLAEQNYKLKESTMKDTVKVLTALVKKIAAQLKVVNQTKATLEGITRL